MGTQSASAEIFGSGPPATRKPYKEDLNNPAAYQAWTLDLKWLSGQALVGRELRVGAFELSSMCIFSSVFPLKERKNICLSLILPFQLLRRGHRPRFSTGGQLL